MRTNIHICILNKNLKFETLFINFNHDENYVVLKYCNSIVTSVPDRIIIIVDAAKLKPLQFMWKFFRLFCRTFLEHDI